MRRTQATLVTFLLAGAGTCLLSGTAVAAPQPHVGNPAASCIGIGTSEHAVNEDPGAIARQVVRIKTIVPDYGFKNFGDIVNTFAVLHLETHAACNT